MNVMNVDISDEATGLPALNQITPEDSFLVLQWQVGAEGLVSSDSDTPVPVRYLSLRGMELDEEGLPVYSQLHIAVPTSTLQTLLNSWQSSLSEYPQV